MLKCKICGHKWQPRTEKEPLACPRCKRYDWKEPVKIGNKGNSKSLFLIITFVTFLSFAILALAATWTTLTQSDFNLGTYSWAYYNTTTGAVILNHTGALVYNTSGDYTSKVYDAGANATWYNMSWIEGVPYGDDLPDNQVDRSGTVLGEVNMTGNVLLLHLNSVNSTNYTLDTSGNRNDGQLVNYPCSPATCNLTAGKFGNAMQFDGVDDYVGVTQSSSILNGNFSLEAWILLSSSKLTYATVLSDFNYISSSRMYGYSLRTGGTDLYFGTRAGGSDSDTNSSNVWVGFTNYFNKWTHIVATFNGTNATLYINGNYAGSGGGGYVPANASQTLIGYSQVNSPDSYFNGTIDEVAIWNRSISATEILNLYKRGALRLNITTRSCDDSACSGESWNETHANATLSTIHEKNNRYFQYKAQLETDSTSYTPELYNVTIEHAFLGASPNATTAKRGDSINITITSSSAPKANITKPDGAVTWLPTPASKGNNIYETNYTFLNSDPSGSYRIGANSSTSSNTTNVTMNSTIFISFESDKMSSDRAIKTKSSKSILAYGISKYAIDNSAPNGKTVTVDYSSTIIGTSTTDSAGSYNYTFSIPYDGDYYLNVNISDSYNNTGTNSTNITIKSRPTYVKYRFSLSIGNYSNVTYRIPTPTMTNVSLSTMNVSNRQYSTNLSHAYVCTYNDLEYSGGMLLALTHSYKMSDLDYVNFSSSFTSQSSNYTLELRDNVDNSKLVMAYTKGTCQLIDSKMYLIEKQTIPTKSMASFAIATPEKLPVSIIAQYGSIQLFGSERFVKGSHRVCIEKPGLSEGNKPLINISRC
jgi:hypothetical protein